ncbi:hypothetical protein COLINT_02678 [Collinsella intestinalis DSM 13280]|uniref:Uncharacterized protein n=1 Tax=Collinsella intestinalis DSM 13280 TaxID=521003 RepID=C4F9E4_9ACTN|nr:hypothetical protein COLINT_02678 [Collinsella intestinalis DSM 13280]
MIGCVLGRYCSNLPGVDLPATASFARHSRCNRSHDFGMWIVTSVASRWEAMQFSMEFGAGGE